MIELRTKEQLSNAINRAKAEARNLLVQTTNAVRQYRVTNRANGNIYLVNFFVRTDGKRFAHCTCVAGEKGIPCKHVAASAALNIYLAENGQLKRRVT
jgi:uncharacterized Zn finger protein